MGKIRSGVDFTSVIPVLGKLRQKDCHNFEARRKSIDREEEKYNE